MKNKITKKFVQNIICTVFLYSIPLTSQATLIEYDVQNFAGNTWEYTYTVTNDTLASDIELIDVFFTLGLYENLAPTVTPAGWDPLVFQPDPAIPADGLYDVLALFVPGIAPGDTLGGFGVQFDFLGTGTPSDQFFEIVDPFTFAPVDSGSTQASSTGPAPVPEPSTIWLAGIGLVGLFGARKISTKT